MEVKRLIPPTLLLALSALFSRLLGIVRDHLLAKTFGATAGAGIYNLDTYYAAFRIPDLLYNLIIFGAISAAFIPIFTQYRKEGDEKSAWEFANSMMHLMLIGMVIIAGAAYLCAPWLAHLVAGGFSPEALQLTSKLMRIMLISPILFSVASILTSIQDSFRCFFFRSLAPLFYNAGIIFGILWWGAEFGVIGVTWGVILGAVLQMCIQLPALKLVHFRYKPILGYARPDVRKAIRLMGPRVLGLSFSQITLVVTTLIASFLGTGSIAIFYFADNLQALPIGLIGISFAITSFATLSELASEQSPDAFAMEIKRVMHRILFLIIPATIGMLVLRREIIGVILLAGKFTQADAEMTARVLGFFLISLFAQSLIPTLCRGFYAYHDTKTPLLAGIVGSFVAISGSLILGLYLHFGITGIAISYTIGNILNCILLYILMSLRLKKTILDWAKTFKIVLMSIVMGVAVISARAFVPFGEVLAQKIAWLAALIAIGVAVYFISTLALLWLCHSECSEESPK